MGDVDGSKLRKRGIFLLRAEAGGFRGSLRATNTSLGRPLASQATIFASLANRTFSGTLKMADKFNPDWCTRERGRYTPSSYDRGISRKLEQSSGDREDLRYGRTVRRADPSLEETQ